MRDSIAAQKGKKISIWSIENVEEPTERDIVEDTNVKWMKKKSKKREKKRENVLLNASNMEEICII